MGDNEDLSLVKFEGQLASFTLDLCKVAPTLSRKAKRSIDVHRARRSLRRALENLDINDGWRPLIVTPEAMPIRALVDIIREANPSEAKAAIFRHILTHFGSMVANVKGVRIIKGISFLEALKLFEGDLKKKCSLEFDSYKIRGRFELTSVESRFSDEIVVDYSLSNSMSTGYNDRPWLRIEFLREETVLKIRKDVVSFASFFIKFARSFNLPELIQVYDENDLGFLSSLCAPGLTVEIDGKFYDGYGERTAWEKQLFAHKIPSLSGQLHAFTSFFIKCVIRSWDASQKLPPSGMMSLEGQSELGYLVRNAVHELGGGCLSAEYRICLEKFASEYSQSHPDLSSRIFDNLEAGRLIEFLLFLLGHVPSHSYNIQVVWQDCNPQIHLLMNPNFPDAAHNVRVMIFSSGTIHIVGEASNTGDGQLRYSCSEDVLREAIVQLGGLDLGLAVCGAIMKRTKEERNLGMLLPLLHVCSATLLRLKKIWHALLLAVHNYEPSIEDMMSARRYRGLGTDVTKGFDLRVVDWEEILSKANLMTEIPTESDITPDILGKILTDTMGLDELYINVVLGRAESGKVKYFRVEKKGVDALWVSRYDGREETSASIPGLDKARSVLFDSIDNFWVSVPSSKTLLVIYKDPGTNINLNESLSKQKTQSTPADASRLVFLELASAIRPSALEKGKVSVSEVMRERNINDAIEGIIFKYGKVEEKIEENVKRDMVIWKRNPLRQSDIMKKVKETTSEILGKEDNAWLERELVATWGKLGMVKIPTFTELINKEEQHFVLFAQAHGPKKQHHLPFIIMDAPVPAAGVLATEVKDDGEIIVGLGGIQLEKSSSYLGKPLYRMKDAKARRTKRKAPDVYMLEQGYIE